MALREGLTMGILRSFFTWIGSLFTWIGSLFSEGSHASCMRFCVFLIITATLFNWTIGTIAVIFGKIESAGMSVPEIVALLGALGMKNWQKYTERKNGGNVEK